MCQFINRQHVVVTLKHYNSTLNAKETVDVADYNVLYTRVCILQGTRRFPNGGHGQASVCRVNADALGERRFSAPNVGLSWDCQGVAAHIAPANVFAGAASRGFACNPTVLRARQRPCCQRHVRTVFHRCEHVRVLSVHWTR